MSQKPLPPITVVIDNKNPSIPDPVTIVRQCLAVRSAQSYEAQQISGFLLVDESRDDTPYAWLKHGNIDTTMSEARTHDFVWRALNTEYNGELDVPVRVPCVYLVFHCGGHGFIVMEYIDGIVCSDTDAALVAAAVEFLITIKSPTTIPGPIGGGLIIHRFFLDWEAPIDYDSVSALGEHVNEILAFVGSRQRVNLAPEVEADGLPLCPCDMNRNNFLKDREGRIVSIDFGATCFLPSSFFDVALYKGRGDPFVKQVTQHLKRPASTQLDALLRASYALVPYGKNTIGIDYKARKPTKNKVKKPVNETG